MSLRYKYQYHDEEQRDGLIVQNSEKYLVEIQEITEGNFLVFTDIEPIKPPLTVSEQVLTIREDTLILMDVLSTIYEDMLAKGTV